MIYLDTTYLVRLYFDDPGFEAVRRLAVTAPVACCILGRAEVSAALHRKLREGALTPGQYRVVTGQFRKECEGGVFRWLPFSGTVVSRVERNYATLAGGVLIGLSEALQKGGASSRSAASSPRAAAPAAAATMPAARKPAAKKTAAKKVVGKKAIAKKAIAKKAVAKKPAAKKATVKKRK